MESRHCFPTKTNWILVLLATIFLSCVSTIEADRKTQVQQNATFPALLAFGDSILDTGNNNNLRTLTKCNFFPYGRDFIGGKATGRFGNGKVFSDLIAESLGVKEILPAYNDPNLQNNDLLTGVSFASGGSGLDQMTASLQGVTWVPDQVNEFKEYIRELNDAVGDQEQAKTIVSTAVFLISAGNNDLAITYFSTPSRAFHYDIVSYTNLMVDWTKSFLKNLYDLGARKFAVLGTLPLGCLPGARSTIGGPFKFCAEHINGAADMFNGKLSTELKKLNNSLTGARFVYVDMYNPLMDLINNPRKSGFSVVADGCCCMPTALIPCLDASRYVFWDFGHPTEKSYKIIVSEHIEDLKNSLA